MEMQAQTGKTASPAVELLHINKRFGAVQANRDVSLSVARGTIHGIVGENGAGKSTLMSILHGYYQADSGTIRVNGVERKIRDSSAAIAAGIGMVHQHFMLVENFTVLENVILTSTPHFLLNKTKDKARETLLALAENYGLNVDPDAIIEDLPVGIQQRVEILKTLYCGAETLILDEPTGVLTPQEAEQLFEILRGLRAQGKTIILITHKLQEIMTITDRVTVMRQGQVVTTLETKETSKEDLAELMVGRRVLLHLEKEPMQPGETLLTVENLTVINQGRAVVDNVSFTARRGEILGIAGVAGNGQSELLETLAGMRPQSNGRFLVRGKLLPLKNSARPAQIVRHAGVGHVPEDRKRMGLIGPFYAWESYILGYHDEPAFNDHYLLHPHIAIDRFRRIASLYDVRPPDPLLKTAAFSGGNQQKIVLAREMGRYPDLLLVGQPTRGVDIGAVEFIHRRLLEMRNSSKAVVLVSADLDEILSLADRILVMFKGRIVGEIPASEANERKLGLLMAGIVE